MCFDPLALLYWIGYFFAISSNIMRQQKESQFSVLLFDNHVVSKYEGRW